MFSKNKTRFHWLATESAPQHFPMRIIEGVFYYRGEDRGLYIPTAASIGYQWGEGESVHVVGEDFKPLPDRVDIRFYSFLEDQLYQGSFDLPYDTILALFKKGVETNIELPTFQDIIIGVAPGGSVAVWVGGAETREVFFGRAEPYDDEMRTPLGTVIEDRESYSASYVEEVPTYALQNIKENGIPFGRWDRYRTPYKWHISVDPAKAVPSIGIAFFNGENYRVELSSEGNVHEPKPLPVSLSFGCVFPGDKTRYVYSVGFDDGEIYEAFERLSSNGQHVHIELDPRLPKRETRVWLNNGEETVELRQLSIRE